MRRFRVHLIAIMLLVSIFGYFRLSERYYLLNAKKTIPTVAFNSVSRGAFDRRKAVEEMNASLKAENVNITVMTYNIHRGVNKQGKLDIGGIAEQISLSGAEIIGLQEVERYSIRTRFQNQIELLAEALTMNFVYGKSLNILNGHYGNAILSKYPIEEYEILELPFNDEKRTVLRALININGYKLYVFNTHLGLSEAERQQQLESIKEILSEQQLDFILLGDFNSRWDKLGMLDEIVSDAAAAIEGAAPITFESEEYSERIDYIFLSKRLKALECKVINSDASDHYPVVSKIELP